MRLWTLHPRYLDPPGLVALWREALLARAVLRGETKGYRHHPQLQRFQSNELPVDAIECYLAAVLEEAGARGYSFDRSKVQPVIQPIRIACTEGQLAHEWLHLRRKLGARSPALHERWRDVGLPDAHPMFDIGPGPVEPWERGVDAG